jgi:ppGpp synthetase/RelA/SpoT-type nucleotidyltranferase
MASYDKSDTEIFEVLQAAEDVAERLRALTGSLGPSFFSTQFYTRLRVKTYSSIIQKLNKKRWEDTPEAVDEKNSSAKVGTGSTRKSAVEPYSFHRMTDVVGFRIVTLYDDDIRRAIEHLLSFIRASSGFQDALFSPFNAPEDGDSAPDGSQDPWDFVREAIFFRRKHVEGVKDVYELLYEDIEAQFTERFGARTLLFDHYKSKLKLRRPVAGDYSSVHFVLNARGRIRKAVVDIPVEVQIRSASEDIWGEINHRLYYKAKDFYVWTTALQKTYEEMDYWSGETKSKLDDVRRPITEFWRRSRAAENLIRQFQEPDVPYHRSLIVTLLYAISKENIGRAERKLREYDDKLKGLANALDDHKAALSIIVDGIRLIGEAADEFAHNQKAAVALAAEDRELTIEMLNQRIMLCAIEKVRLEALAIFHYNHRLAADSDPEPLDKSTRAKELRRIFDAMCEQRNNSELKVRPVAMLSHWKHLISKNIDPALGMHHLQVAANELDDDHSLPLWSIYHIDIRRSLAFELFTEAMKLLEGNGSRSAPEVFWRSQLSVVIQGMLERAFGLVLESHTRQQNKDEKAGDLIFGYRKDEEMLDAKMLAGITMWYLFLFGRLDCKRLGTSVEFVTERILEVRKFLEDGGDVGYDSPGGKSSMINRLDESMEKLSNQG